MGHIRGLDGIRALSVPAITAFHTGLRQRHLARRDALARGYAGAGDR